MNSYHIRLSHVLGILANANACTACSRLCLVVAHTSSIPGNLGTWTGRIHSIVDKGMDADTLGGLGDRCPCQNVPTVLVAQTTVPLVGQLAPRMWVHQAERESHWRRHVA